MPINFRGERRQRVQFVEESKPSDTVTKSAREGGGPFFPNLQLMFKNKQHESSSESFSKEEEMISKPSEEKTTSKTSGDATSPEEDIDSIANMYIKRKHHDLYLQKLMSMNATAAK
ncbi:hypothetical protein HPP92_023367 [Vanilla planifolia]|uniref:Uncharacterized protein n=1 Tax=Vanilla planifolia TaxID=51239 RepID=A0A835PQ82_VANPL|nr:hypothetical protein HPP92_023367 [Vanilla planifolia]